MGIFCKSESTKERVKEPKEQEHQHESPTVVSIFIFSAKHLEKPRTGDSGWILFRLSTET